VKNRCKNEKCFSMKKLEIIYFFMIKLEKKIIYSLAHATGLNSLYSMKFLIKLDYILNFFLFFILYMLEESIDLYTKGGITLIWIINCTRRKNMFNSHTRTCPFFFSFFFFFFLNYYLCTLSFFHHFLLPGAGDQEGGAE
jgi:hypothetical protein